MPKRSLLLLISLLFTPILATTVSHDYEEWDKKFNGMYSQGDEIRRMKSKGDGIPMFDSQVPLDYEEWDKTFDKMKSEGDLLLFYEIRKIIWSILTLPSTIVGDPVKETINYINEFVESGMDYIDSELYIEVYYQIFTPSNAPEGFLLENSFTSFHRSSFDDRLETKVLIHGFSRFMFDNHSIIYDIKDKILQKGDYNVIVVDWNQYNGFPYYEAAQSAAFVGFEIAKLINTLLICFDATPQSFHLIGYSLGGHVAGFAGKVIQNIGRITALDVTGLIFDYLPSHMRLTDTDAGFVDVIHTYGTSDKSGGLGTLSPYGDIDFYPNGGSLQPGCRYGDMHKEENKRYSFVETPLDIIFCNHQRALHLFLKSFDDCSFISVHCESYEDFKSGKCSNETSLVARMGFYSMPIPSLPPHSKFYLDTTGKQPFCIR